MATRCSSLAGCHDAEAHIRRALYALSTYTPLHAIAYRQRVALYQYSERKRSSYADLSICVCASVCLSESVLWQNGWVDPDAVWDGEWGQSNDGCIKWGGDRRSGRGSFGGEFGAFHCNQLGLCGIVLQERRTLLKLLWGLVVCGTDSRQWTVGGVCVVTSAADADLS